MNDTMDARNFDFAWNVCDSGYHWLDASAVVPEFADPKLQADSFLTDGNPAGGPRFEVRRYQPLKEHTGLFQIFADTESNPEGVQEFAAKFGLLGGEEQEL